MDMSIHYHMLSLLTVDSLHPILALVMTYPMRNIRPIYFDTPRMTNKSISVIHCDSSISLYTDVYRPDWSNEGME
jgi:hypothetical protein